VPPEAPEFVRRVISKALDDVTPKVRAFAAETAHSFGIQESFRKSIRENVIPLLSDHLKSEEDDTVKRQLLFTILRVGERYELCETVKDRFVLIRTPKEGCCELLCPIALSRPYVQSLVEASKGWTATIPIAPPSIMAVCH